MKRLIVLITIISVAVLTLLPLSAMAGNKEEEKIYDSIEVMEQITSIPEQSIPPALLRNAEGIAIIPNVIKAGFILGGRYGAGVAMVRERDGEWSNPIFITITGGSIGWQIGAQSTDIILVFKSRRSVENLIGGKFTLGADASIAAGPVGRHAEAGTDIQFRSEIYSYSRSRGLFAGLALEGAGLSVDDDADDTLYGRVSPRDILAGKVKAPESVERLRRLMNKISH